MSGTDYRQKRCSHGWVNGNQCDQCAKDRRLEKAEELIHELAGVLGRLESYGYIGHDVDDSERDQCDHWRDLGRQAVGQAKLFMVPK